MKITTSPSSSALIILCLLPLWYLCSGTTDTINATFLIPKSSSSSSKHSALSLTFVTLFWSAVSGWTWYYVCPFARVWPRPPMARLFSGEMIKLGIVNTLAFWFMHIAFMSGMTYTYAFKHTEPLFVVIFAWASKRLLGISSPQSSPTRQAFAGVVLVIMGAVTLSGAADKSGSPAAPLVVAATLSLASTALFALRTLLTKPILSMDATTSSSSSASCCCTTSDHYDAYNLFLHVAVVGVVMLLPPYLVFHGAAMTGFLEAPRTVLLHVVAGSFYFVYHCLGNVVLNLLSPLSYAMAKQSRVVVVFLFSFVLSNTLSAENHKKGGSIEVLSAVLGLGLVLVGTWCYAVGSIQSHNSPGLKNNSFTNNTNTNTAADPCSSEKLPTAQHNK
eukprot:PhM_4_TR2010/c0_g1_i1/m.35644/K15283/SLC35E1; solute carrier family 35, member E1